MPNYPLLAMQVKPPEFDLGASALAGAKIGLTNTSALLNQYKLNEGLNERSALRDYAGRMTAGDPQASQALWEHPEQLAQVQKTQGVDEAARNQRNLQRASQVLALMKGGAAPADIATAWRTNLDAAVSAGDMPSLMHRQLSGMPPNEALLKAIIEGSQKPMTELERAQAGHYRGQEELDRARAAALPNEQFRPLPADAPGVFSGRTGEVRAAPGDAFQNIARKEAAKDAPKSFKEAQAALVDAQTNLNTVRELRQVAPLASTGALAEPGLALKKLVQVFGFNPRDLGLRDNVAPTEYLQAAINKFSIAEAKKLYPISNADLGFIQKAVGSISTDPTALPLILGAMERVYEREIRYRQLEAAAVSQQAFPDRNAIIAQVNKEFPSFIEGWLAESGQSGQRSGPPGAKAQTDRLQPNVAQEIAQARRALANGAPQAAVIELMRRRGVDPSMLFSDRGGIGSQ